MNAKVLFYHWDWKEQPECGDLQRAIDAVFNGSNAPRITDSVPTADWDRNTLAITSIPVPPEKIGALFDRYIEGEGEDSAFWWELDSSPVPLEIEV